ncbi:MAG TPA: cation diffusion facilitator family transporter [Rhizomicrobium sp.]|nr:cation diffusion facilitator family transporter [Rhizomicrobium sp.]
MDDRTPVSVMRAADTGHGTLMRRAALASLTVTVFLIVLKFAAYIMTDSVSMLASLADSGLDFFASMINLVAVRSSLTPPDREHRFGHGKAEALAGLAQGAFIAGSATFLIIEAVSRLTAPHIIGREVLGLAVMAVSIAATIGLVAYQRMVVARTDSLAISSDKSHYTSDLVTNIGVVASLVLSTQFGWIHADPIIAIAIALFLAWTSWTVFRASSDQLMDRELPDEDRAKIKTLVMRHPDVRNLHDLRTRTSGLNTFIQFHIELDADISLTRAHEISDAVEADVMAAYPKAEILIHQDPAGVEMPAPLAKV